MELDKSIAMQKHVRDNAEALRSEFLDMKNWEEQMRKTEMELVSSSSDHNQSLPPIRRKKTSTRSKSKNKDNGGKSKRIKSYDYTAWDQFDVDKACEEIDKENESEDSGEELLSKEELEKKHEEATKHKVMGNTYVKEQKWNKALACYSEAIKVFPHDAVFWANRALCHLKINNFFSADSDCTAAIQRDDSYVKAYHRRATARMALKQYAEAVEDLKKLLSLESGNKEAKKMLVTAQKALDASKPIDLSSSKAEKSSSKPEKPTITLKIVDVLQPKVNDKGIDETGAFIEEVGAEKIAGDEDSRNKLRDWLPDIEEDVEEVRAIDKLPHQRSKKPLRTVPITTSDFAKLTLKPSEVDPKNSPEIFEKSVKTDENLLKDEQKLSENAEKESVPSTRKLEIPSVPKTAVQFMMAWNKDKSLDFRYQYLKQIPPESIPLIFQDALESNTFNEILQVLKNGFIPRGDAVFNYLYYLSEIKRFRMLTMFMGNQEKEDLKNLFNHCTTKELKDTAALVSKYEL